MIITSLSCYVLKEHDSYWRLWLLSRLFPSSVDFNQHRHPNWRLLMTSDEYFWIPPLACVMAHFPFCVLSVFVVLSSPDLPPSFSTFCRRRLLFLLSSTFAAPSFSQFLIVELPTVEEETNEGVQEWQPVVRLRASPPTLNCIFMQTCVCIKNTAMNDG